MALTRPRGWRIITAGTSELGAVGACAHRDLVEVVEQVVDHVGVAGEVAGGEAHGLGGVHLDVAVGTLGDDGRHCAVGVLRALDGAGLEAPLSAELLGGVGAVQLDLGEAPFTNERRSIEFWSNMHTLLFPCVQKAPARHDVRPASRQSWEPPGPSAVNGMNEAPGRDGHTGR